MAKARFIPLEYHTKIIVIGGHSSGKTTLINRFTRSTQSCVYQNKNSKGINKTIDATAEKAVHMNIYEIENLRLILKDSEATQALFQGNIVILCVVDLTNRDSLDTIQTHLLEIRNICKDPPPRFLLVGNKFDKETVIFTQDLNEFVKTQFLPPPIQCSALNDVNDAGVLKVFSRAADLAISWEERKKNFDEEKAKFKIYQDELIRFINDTQEHLPLGCKKNIELARILQKVYEVESIIEIKKLASLTRVTVSEHQDTGWYGLAKGTFFRKTTGQLNFEKIFDEENNLIPRTP